jgi:glycosyltransferase involved in cell wall biosynthesis
VRVLQIAPPWFEVPPRRYGGTELVIAGLSDELVRRGHEVTLLASGGSVTSAHLVSEFEVPPSDRLGDPLVELAQATAIDDLSGFDVVHDHTLFGAVVADARGTTPVVLTLHAPLTERSTPLLRRLARHVALVGISHDQVARAGDLPIDAVVHNGLDLADYGRGDGPRGEDLLFLGRASPDKGPDLAIEVARRSGRHLTMAIKVNEADEQAYWRDVLAPRCAAWGVDVVLGAEHARKVELLRRAYALLVPIRWPEPFGLVMAEAAACGTPAVAFARGAAPEIIVDGVTGRLVDPAEGVEGLVDALTDVADVDAATCVARVAERFSVTAMTDGYLDVYERVIRRPTGDPSGTAAVLRRCVRPA